jgi:hypothetical protein
MWKVGETVIERFDTLQIECNLNWQCDTLKIKWLKPNIYRVSGKNCPPITVKIYQKASWGYSGLMYDSKGRKKYYEAIRIKK